MSSTSSASSDQIVLDLETKKTFDEAGGRNPAELGVTVVGTYSYKTDEYIIFEEHQAAELEQRLSETTRIIGFNIRRFDFPVLQPYLKHLNLSHVGHLDIMDELEKVLGHRVSLQSVASATLNEGKSGSGLDAIHYYRSGDMVNLKKYCLDDVRLTRDVYEFGKKHGHVFYFSRDGQTRMKAEIHWQDPVPPANFSLF